MSDFSDSTTPVLLNPYKRVRYTHGLVLGVPEFEQEQLYFLEKGQLHQRALHGYGTVCGLKVGLQDGPEVQVSPGLAANPIGQLIRVTRTQCASLNTWLTRADVRTALTAVNEGENAAVDADGNGHVTVHVILCYDECAVDPVPIPGAPCRSQEESVAPSRIVDSFRLEFAFTSPDQVEEGAVRRYGALLARLEISDDGGPYVTEAELLELVRGLSSASEADDAGSVLRLHPDQACAVLTAMARVWATEVRGALAGTEGCVTAPAGSCVLLGTLDFDVSAWAAPADLNAILVDETQRPVLLHTRLLQEWLLCGRSCAAGVHANTFATLLAYPPEPASHLRAWVHYPTLLTIPGEAIQVRVDDLALNPEQVTISRLEGLNVFDISLSSPIVSDNVESPDGQLPFVLAAGARVTVLFDATAIAVDQLEGSLRDHMGDQHFNLDRQGDVLAAHLLVSLLSLQDLQDVSLSDGLSAGNALVFDGNGWTNGDVVRPGDAAGGDLYGTYRDPQVGGLRKIPIVYPGDSSSLNDRDVLTLRAPVQRNATWQWTPSSISTVLGDAKEGEVLTYSGGVWGAAAPAGGGATGNATGDLSGTYPGPQVSGILGKAIQVPQGRQVPHGQSFYFEEELNQWRLAGPGGDLRGNYPYPTVGGLVGFAINAPSPIPEGALLQYFKGQWNVVSPAAAAAGISRLSLAEVYWSSDGLNGGIWFHPLPGKPIKTPAVAFANDLSALTIWDDTSGKAVSFELVSAKPNQLQIRLSGSARSPRVARVVLDVRATPLNDGGTLFDLIQQRGVHYLGFDDSRFTVTLFTQIPSSANIG